MNGEQFLVAKCIKKEKTFMLDVLDFELKGIVRGQEIEGIRLFSFENSFKIEEEEEYIVRFLFKRFQRIDQKIWIYGELTACKKNTNLQRTYYM